MRTVIYNIGTLAGILPEDVLKLEGAQMNEVNCLNNAYLVIEDGVIADFGPMENCPGMSSEEHAGPSENMVNAKAASSFPHSATLIPISYMQDAVTESSVTRSQA